jgi:hypothetical protein
MISNPTQRLSAYFHKQCDVHDVLRSIMSHTDWLVPTDVFTGHYGRYRTEQEHLFGHTSELPPGELWLYTDEAAAQQAHAQGAKLGSYSTGMRGVEIFEFLPAGVSSVRVNPVLAPELGWNFPPESFGLVSAWCMALRFEDDVATWQNNADVSRLLSYPQFQIFVYPDGRVLTMPDHAGMTNPTIVCSSPDSTREILNRVPEPLRSELQMCITTGHELLAKLPKQGMDGMILNPVGPGPMFAFPFGQL